MPWTVEYVPERDMALVVATGEIFDRDARGQVAEAIRLLQEHRANLVLVDYADASGWLHARGVQRRELPKPGPQW